MKTRYQQNANALFSDEPNPSLCFFETLDVVARVRVVAGRFQLARL